MIIGLIAAAAALPFHLHEQRPDIDFDYRWPSQASAIPSLRRRLDAEFAHDRSRSGKLAATDRVESRKNNYPFRQHSFSRRLLFGGESARLASFADERSAFTGGAHPNPGTSALLWDKATGRSVEFTGLFARRPSNLLRPRYCKRLAEERKQKLGSELPAGKFWDVCPDPLTLAVIPEDRNHNGRFETINVTASPYAVGSYAEGYYIVMLPVTAALIAALRPQYRASFEAQRQ
jgi:hypothetical protein